MTPEQKQEALAAWPEWWGEPWDSEDGKSLQGDTQSLDWTEDEEWCATHHRPNVPRPFHAFGSTAALAIAELLELCPELRKPDDLAGRVDRALTLYDEWAATGLGACPDRMAAILRGEE